MNEIIIFFLAFNALVNKKLQDYLFLDRFFPIAFNLEEQKNPYSCFPFNAGCKFITQRKFFDFHIFTLTLFKTNYMFFRHVRHLQNLLRAVYCRSVYFDSSKKTVNLVRIISDECISCKNLVRRMPIL